SLVLGAVYDRSATTPSRATPARRSARAPLLSLPSPTPEARLRPGDWPGRERRLFACRENTKTDTRQVLHGEPTFPPVRKFCEAGANPPRRPRPTFPEPLAVPSGDIPAHWPRQVICHLLTSHHSGEVTKRPAPHHARQ